MATERATNSIAVEKFRSSEDDFGEWISLFEDSVVLATGVTDDDRKKSLFLKWLPFKLDDQAKTVFRSIASVNYTDVKKELKALLIDQQEAYAWQTNKSCLEWDGKESFHALAVRVRRAVDKYDPDSVKEKEYFFRFRQALPKRYKTAIDLGCAEDKRKIDEAKKIAMRLQMTETDDDKGKEVTFTGASMADDRLKSLEMDFKKMDVRMDSFEGKLDSVGETLKELVAKPKGHESSLERYESRYRDRRAGGRQFSQDRRESQDRRDGRGGYGGGYRDNSRDRRNNDYRDRRDDRGRNDRPYDGDRRRSGERRDSTDRGTRRGSRDQWDRRGSRDRQDGRNFGNRGNSRDRGGNRDQGRQGSREFRGGQERRESRERRPSQDRGRTDGRRDGSRERGAQTDNRSSGQSSNNASRGESYRAAENKGSADEDYDLYCSVLSNIEERRAKRRKN